MTKKVGKKFAWVIKNFSSLQCDKFYSVPFQIDDCKWRILAYPKGDNCDHLSLFLEIADVASLPSGWRRYVKLRLSVVKQLVSLSGKTEHCFDGKSTIWGFPAMLPLTNLHDKDGGFLVNGELMIVAELDVLDVIGTLVALENPEDASKLVSKKKENVGVESNDLLKKTSPPNESNNVNGIKQMQNSVKTNPKKKRMWIAFLMIVWFLNYSHDMARDVRNARL
ncbi:MATH domain and coiled-coil domain-containing protein At3g58410 [Capsella rubella]|uniref:MATH domain and coiled-coil domain-containing protein At3g58410 n=1 Tax=Capsella rubella TaxID=81985 RepID=UPI000CD4F852|nr:MATH domain and coiled-coil domain-containing protein At3g58410 [Capsella rubella]